MDDATAEAEVAHFAIPARGTGKSTVVSHIGPVWDWLHSPSRGASSAPATLKRRHGLNPPLRGRTLDDLAKAEEVAAAIMRGERRFRRIGDPPGTVRVVDPARVGISDMHGLRVAVIGYVNGVRDPGLDCHDCPLCFLEVVHDQG